MVLRSWIQIIFWPQYVPGLVPVVWGGISCRWWFPKNCPWRMIMRWVIFASVWLFVTFYPNFYMWVQKKLSLSDKGQFGALWVTKNYHFLHLSVYVLCCVLQLFIMPMGTACEYMLLVSTRIEQPKNIHLESMNISVKKYIEKEPKNRQTGIWATISNLRWALEAGSKMLRHPQNVFTQTVTWPNKPS